MHDREFWLRHIDVSVGDTVYYVTGSDAIYSITKTRITEVCTRHTSFDRHFGLDYRVYKTEDGAVISQWARNRKDELDPAQVFLAKDEAVQFIIGQLNEEINREKHAILHAQARLARAERVLKNYRKYMNGNE